MLYLQRSDHYITARAHSSHRIISKAELWFSYKQRQQCGEARCFPWLQTGVLKVLMWREWSGDCNWLKASMKMYPMSSRLSSDHSAQTDAALSCVLLTVVAVVAFIPRVRHEHVLPCFFYLSRGIDLSWHQLQVTSSSQRTAEPIYGEFWIH